MFNLKSGVAAALALTVLAGTPALAQDHGMSGRSMDRGMHHMSRADMRMMDRCQRMSHRAMMRNRSCMRVMAMRDRMDRGMDDHRDGRMDGRDHHM